MCAVCLFVHRIYSLFFFHFSLSNSVDRSVFIWCLCIRHTQYKHLFANMLFYYTIDRYSIQAKRTTILPSFFSPRISLIPFLHRRIFGTNPIIIFIWYWIYWIYCLQHPVGVNGKIWKIHGYFVCVCIKHNTRSSWPYWECFRQY